MCHIGTKVYLFHDFPKWTNLQTKNGKEFSPVLRIKDGAPVGTKIMQTRDCRRCGLRQLRQEVTVL